jgi:hypothetical protein
MKYILSKLPLAGAQSRHWIWFAFFYPETRTIEIKQTTMSIAQAADPTTRKLFAQNVLYGKWAKEGIRGISCITHIDLLSWFQKISGRWSVKEI